MAGGTYPLDMPVGAVWVQTDCLPRIRSFSDDYSEIRINAEEIPTITDILYGENAKETYNIVNSDMEVLATFSVASTTPTSMGDPIFAYHGIQLVEPLDSSSIPEDGELFVDFRGMLDSYLKWIYEGNNVLRPFKEGDVNVVAKNSIYIKGGSLVVNIEGEEKRIPLMASSLDEVIENLERSGNNIAGGVRDAVSEIANVLLKEGVESFNKQYGEELTKILKIHDIERNAEIIKRKTVKGIAERRNEEESEQSAAKYEYLGVTNIDIEKNYIEVIGEEHLIYSEGEKIGLLYREVTPTIEVSFDREISATNVEKPIIGLEKDIRLHVSGQTLVIPYEDFNDRRLSLDAVAEKISKRIKEIEPTFACSATKNKLIFRQFGSKLFGATSGIHPVETEGLIDIVERFGIEANLIEHQWKPERIEREVTIKAVVKDTNSSRVLLFVEEPLTGIDAMNLVNVAIAPLVTSDAMPINVKTAKMVYNSRLFGIGIRQLFSRGDDGFSGLYVSNGTDGHGIPKGLPYVALPTKEGVAYIVVEEDGSVTGIASGESYKPSTVYETIEVPISSEVEVSMREGHKFVTITPSSSDVKYNMEDTTIHIKGSEERDTKVCIKWEF